MGKRVWGVRTSEFFRYFLVKNHISIRMFEFSGLMFEFLCLRTFTWWFSFYGQSKCRTSGGGGGYYVFGQPRTDRRGGLKISIVAGRPSWMPLNAITYKLTKPQSSHLGRPKDFYHIKMFVCSHLGWPKDFYHIKICVAPYPATQIFFYGPVEISIGNSFWPRVRYLTWLRMFTKRI